MRTSRSLVSLALGPALLVALLAGCTASAPNTAVPRFEPGVCAFIPGDDRLIDGFNLRCGLLVVREDHSNPHSRTINLAVAILRTRSETPAPDPVIYLSGGPGESPLTDFAPAFTYDGLKQYLGNRDLIIFDPRGTANSEPSLDCPELREAEYGSLDQNLTPTQEVAIQRAALMRCHSRLVGEGIDLSLYNTVSSAADVNDLIQALGYSQVNLNGGSYGTRLALEIMKDYPKHIRSVILDAVFPPQVTFFTALPPAFMRSFDTLFAGCAADASCNQHYPHLEDALYSLIAQLNAHPATLHVQDPSTSFSYTVILNGQRLVNLLVLSLYETDLIPFMPAAIYDALRGDTGQLTTFFDRVEFQDDAISRGMWYSVECAEDAPFVTAQDIATAEQALTPPLRAADPFNLAGRWSVCQFWNVHPLPATQKQAVTSAIPTLILEGAYDPVTPPANGELAAHTLSHSYLVNFPAGGHGSMFSTDCPQQIGLAFQDDPQHAPDTSCIGQMGGPNFYVG